MYSDLRLAKVIIIIMVYILNTKDHHRSYILTNNITDL